MAITTKIRGSSQIIAGTITNTEINASAGITEGKLSFSSTGGHDHNGTNSTLISGANITGHFVYNEIPTGTINSSNTLFTLANTPLVSSGTTCSMDMYLNGVHLQPGTSNVHNDFFITSTAATVVTTTFAPTTGDLIVVTYLK